MQILNTAVLRLHAMLRAVSHGTRTSWVLLALVSLSLLTSPLTQHLWTWDRFLKGGQDFETGALLILISLCLVTVSATICKLGLERMLFALRALGLQLPPPDPACLFFAKSLEPSRALNARAACSLPLLI